MGIVEEELASVSLSTGQEITIEYNEGGDIHIHVGNFRLDFSEKEFQTFANVVKEGKRDLIKIKDDL